MPDLLGSLLLRKGLITQAQLDAGLAAQARYKGRLGTNLVERKFLSLAELGLALAEQRGCTLATREELDSATANVLVSKRVAKLHLAVPLRVENRVLLVAMASAWDVDAVEALERELRSRVRAVLAPELVILRYLDRVYDLKASRPVSVYDHAFGAARDALAAPSADGFLSQEGDEQFLQASTPAPQLGKPLPSATLPVQGPPRRHIESSFDALVRASVPVLRKTPAAAQALEDGLEDADVLADDLPVLSGTVLEGGEASAADKAQSPAPVPDIPDEWK
ncbi:MAG: hypothetical protein QM765_50575 [Myxococcales bacterium]